ncbi:MAG: hypothetical protein COV52_03835 [Gammaproteobacteria bacterium CG11_big_fil_rev_8_21_14_0_20_46_22]|nr:MAG: hypothetical protein COW05_01885 [Gammaproteobacteria bacterium CG12_big_fil_rev_8_21_14_0_65_46_12]PIR11451.1 MAG: hypothetical protein COV52_03835 [Gammaproteobacteria bacterium CG11_big_fil_rev_8_21_14_0_20_46_22]
MSFKFKRLALALAATTVLSVGLVSAVPTASDTIINLNAFMVNKNTRSNQLKNLVQKYKTSGLAQREDVRTDLVIAPDAPQEAMAIFMGPDARAFRFGFMSADVTAENSEAVADVMKNLNPKAVAMRINQGALRKLFLLGTALKADDKLTYVALSALPGATAADQTSVVNFVTALVKHNHNLQNVRLGNVSLASRPATRGFVNAVKGKGAQLKVSADQATMDMLTGAGLPKFNICADECGGEGLLPLIDNKIDNLDGVSVDAPYDAADGRGQRVGQHGGMLPRYETANSSATPGNGRELIDNNASGL